MAILNTVVYKSHAIRRDSSKLSMITLVCTKQVKIHVIFIPAASVILLTSIRMFRLSTGTAISGVLADLHRRMLLLPFVRENFA